MSNFTNRHGLQFIEHILYHFSNTRFIFTIRDEVIWVLQGADTLREKVKQQLPIALASWLDFNLQSVGVGIGTIKETLLNIEQSMEESQHALRHTLNGNGVSIVCYEQLGINRLFNKQTTSEIRQFVEAVLSPILTYKDEILILTLKTYIQHNRSISLTANILHIHQNTLYHRLGKIEQLLGRSLSNHAEFLEITLALHLYETI